MQNEDERIKTVIKEITYWKENKLLPAVYCDYLLALYTKGKGIPKEHVKINRDKSILLNTISIVLLSFYLPFAFLLIYYTQLLSLIKIGILLLFIAPTFIIDQHLKRQGHLFRHLSLIVLLMLFLIITIYISSFFTNNQYLKQSVLLFNFISWFILARQMRLRYLAVSSSFAILFMLIYIVL